MRYFNAMTVPLLLVNVNFEYYSCAQYLRDLIVFVSAIKIYCLLHKTYSIILCHIYVLISI